MDKYKTFGIDRETSEKSKDILPTLELGKIDKGDKVLIQFLEDMPKEVEVKNKFSTTEKDKTVLTKVMKVKTIALYRQQDDGEFLEVPINEKNSLWLTSESLRLGVFNLYESNSEKLAGVKAMIKIGTAEYKKYGINRCYTVSQFTD